MRKTGLTIGLSAALLTTSCGGETAPTVPESSTTSVTSTTAVSCGRLALPEFKIGRPHGMVGHNKGECANVRDEHNLKDIGSIAADADFYPICLTGPKPAGIRIEFPAKDDLERRGEVLLDDAAIAALGTSAFPPELKEC